MPANVTRVKVHQSEIERIMHLPQVTTVLHTVATGIAERARGDADDDEVKSSIFVEDGVRPKGRPYSRAVSDPDSRYYLYRKRDRRDLLRRAADIPT